MCSISPDSMEKGISDIDEKENMKKCLSFHTAFDYFEIVFYYVVHTILILLCMSGIAFIVFILFYFIGYICAWSVKYMVLFAKTFFPAFPEDF